MLPPYLPTSSHNGWPKKQQTRRHVKFRLNSGAQQQVHQGNEAGTSLSKHQAMSIIKDIYLLVYVFM